MEQLQIRQELVLLQEVEKLKAAVDEELQRQSTGALWGQPALQLMQLPGVGYIVAMTVLSAIGDITRFETAKRLVGYAGLGARMHDSGKTHKEKKITKKGRRELRWAMVEAAWRAVGTQGSIFPARDCLHWNRLRPRVAAQRQPFPLPFEQ